VAEALKSEDRHEITITMTLHINVKGTTLAIYCSYTVYAVVMIVLSTDKLKEHENLISEDGLPRSGVPSSSTLTTIPWRNP
jgi:hypothetical protein